MPHCPVLSSWDICNRLTRAAAVLFSRHPLNPLPKSHYRFLASPSQLRSTAEWMKGLLWKGGVVIELRKSSPNGAKVWSIRLDVYGREVLVQRTEGRWSAFYVGTDGKLRSATDIVIPTSVEEADLQQYLADLFHEWATEQHPDVRKLD